MKDRSRNHIWNKIKKVKWDNRSWYAILFTSILLLILYIRTCFFYYDAALSKGGNPNNFTINNLFNRILHDLDISIGKTPTIIILGIITLIPFIIAFYKYIKWKKQR